MRFILDEAALTAVLGWWRALHPAADGAHGGERGGRARLRRAQTPLDALLEPRTHELIGRVRDALGDRWPEQKSAETALCERLVVLALALARIEPGRISREPFAAALGRAPDGRFPGREDRRRLSPLRFSVLLRAADHAETFSRALRRALPALKDVGFDVPRFIKDVLAFDDETRRAWIFQYHHTLREPETQATEADQLPEPAKA